MPEFPLHIKNNKTDDHCAEEVCSTVQGESPERPAITGGTKYYLGGLSCASCAAKIEQKLNQMDGVRAELSFASSTLVLDTDSRELEEEALAVVKKIEPHIKIKKIEDEEGEEEEENAGPSILLKIFLAGIFFITGLVIQNYVYPDAEDLPLSDLRFWAVLMPYLIGYIIAGHDVVTGAVKGIISRDFFGESLLMSIATLGAFAIKEFPEAVGVMLFFKVGEYFEDRALNHSRRSIKNLLKIRPDYANLRKNGITERVKPQEVQVGDLIMVKPGEKVPLDGVVEEGQSSVDTSALTGESMPRSLKEGDEVLSGMINRNAVITVRVTKVFSDSTVSRILDLVEKASAQKAPTEKFITKFSKAYTPAVVAGAFALAVLPPVIYQIPALTSVFSHPETYSEWIYRALVFLVIACPCALVISIPLGFFGGIGAASRNGVLFKGSNYLEGFRDIRTMVFDKTGTLTEGVFKVTEVMPRNGF
ncbi:Lead, cadmium, zinc and mercury transporting ATPase; Copper-translocating P-type ATPase, partial [hydrothermal vent metagenome]